MECRHKALLRIPRGGDAGPGQDLASANIREYVRPYPLATLNTFCLLSSSINSNRLKWLVLLKGQSARTKPADAECVVPKRKTLRPAIYS